MSIDIALPSGWEPTQYALLDSGAEYKLERFGSFILKRPDPQAIWQPHRPSDEWARVDATFSKEADSDASGGKSAHWTVQHALPDAWPVVWRDLTLLARLTPFKHTGIFPEQAVHWDWIAARIASVGSRQVRLLNLFGYTGIASLVAARAGAHVTHLDAAPKVIEWARENQAQNGMQDAPIRWIMDDALKFVHREARRAARYDLIVMDPPAFGRGPKGEVWKFESSLPPLLDACRALLSERSLGVLINSYSLRASALLLGNMLADMLAGQRTPGTISVGELALPAQESTRLLPAALYARWEP